MSKLSPGSLLAVENSLSPLPCFSALDKQDGIIDSEFPQTEIGIAGAFASVPALVKIAAFSVSATGAPRGRGFILAEQRPVSVRTGGLSLAGERCSAFFCTL